MVCSSQMTSLLPVCVAPSVIKTYHVNKCAKNIWPQSIVLPYYWLFYQKLNLIIGKLSMAPNCEIKLFIFALWIIMKIFKNILTFETDTFSNRHFSSRIKHLPHGWSGQNLILTKTILKFKLNYPIKQPLIH